jgi:hypothetical protein
MPRGRLALLALASLFLLAVVLDFPPQIRGPAPYPPEWQWALREGPTSGRWAPPVLAAALLLGLMALSGSPWALARSRGAARAIVAAAVALGFALSVGLLGLEPSGAFRTLAARTMSPSWSSYYSVAVSAEAADPIAFLDRHAELLPRLPKHAATHPPGPVLYYRGLVALFERSPTLTRTFLALQGHDETQEPRPPNTRASKAAALFGALVLTLLGMAAAWPVAAIAARLSGDPLSGARVGALWTLVPGPVLFVPQFDQALALAVAGVLALLLAAAAEPRSLPRTTLAAAAGLVAGIALVVSYGSLAFLLVAGVAYLAVAGVSQRTLLVGVVADVAAFVVIGATALLGHDPLDALLTALSIHRETYTEPRSYFLWLPFNLLDLSIFLGPPVAALFVREVFRSRSARWLAIALAVLLVSGATRGEVGRIWIPLMPMLLLAATAMPGRPSRGESLWLGALLVAMGMALRSRWVL